MIQNMRILIPRLALLIFVMLAALLNLISLNHHIVSPGEISSTSLEEITPTEAFIKEEPTKMITAKPTPSPTPKPANSLTLRITYYGWVDNDPPGRAIAYPQKKYPLSIHLEAGGVGTYSDPVTLAVKKGRWPVGTRFYLPYIQKYGIVEDICANCRTDHLDVWMESNGNYPEELLSCENRWTRNSEDVEISPKEGKIVNPSPLFDSFSGQCS